MSERDGVYAFPVTIGSQADQHESGPGMYLRDWFAGQAMNAFIACPHPWTPGGEKVKSVGPDDVASAAYEFADAMIAARNGDSDD